MREQTNRSHEGVYSPCVLASSVVRCSRPSTDGDSRPATLSSHKFTVIVIAVITNLWSSSLGILLKVVSTALKCRCFHPELVEKKRQF